MISIRSGGGDDGRSGGGESGKLGRDSDDALRSDLRPKGDSGIALAGLSSICEGVNMGSGLDAKLSESSCLFFHSSFFF